MNEPDIDDQPGLNAGKEWPEMDFFDVRIKPHRGGRDIPVPVAARNVQKMAALERTEALAALNTRPVTLREAEAIIPICAIEERPCGP